MTISQVYKNIVNHTPNYVKKTIFKLLPLVFISSLVDIFGLLIILPILKIILEPHIIQENSHLHWLFNKLQFSSEMQFVAFLLASTVCFFIFKNIIAYHITSSQSKLSFKVATNLVINQFERFIKKPFQFHTEYKTGDLLRSIIEIPYNFVNGILLPLVVIINEIIVASIIFIALVIYNPLLFLSVFFFVAPVFFLYTRIQKKKLKAVSLERDQSHTEMFSRGRQGLEGFREIILFDKLNYFKPRLEDAVDRFSQAFGKIYVYNGFSPRVIEGIAVLSIFGIFLTGVFLEYQITVVASFLTTFAIAAYRLIPSINKGILSYNNLKSSEFVFEHLDKLEVEKNNCIKVAKGSFIPLNFSSKIEINNISFKFQDSSNRIIKNTSFTIYKGETIGIIGESGSGKTTLLNIFLMLLKQDLGDIKVDGIDLTEDLKHRWYKTISYVPQNVIIIPGSILENVTFGIPNEEVNYKKLEEVIEKSQLKDLINDLPLGVNTKVGGSGLNISGGQRQRIGIARALYHSGSILIFDEATSALDKETEYQLTESIKNLSNQNYTIIIVAHRLETLRYCDKIYKIDKGKIGTPMSYQEIL